MATLTKSYTFTARTAVAPITKLDTDFVQLYAFLTTGGSVSHRDGSQNFTGLPSITNPSPSGGNAMVSKAYFDYFSFNVEQVKDTGNFIPAIPDDSTLTTQALLVEGGLTSVAFTAGVGTLTFPTAFPNQAMLVTAQPQGSVNGGATGGRLGVSSLSATTAGLNFPAAASTTVPICWIAFGF